MRPNFDKNPYGLIPAVVQDNKTGRVLTVGFMNRKAYKKTLKNGLVTLFSHKKNRLLSESDEGGNLKVVDIKIGCSSDSVLVKALPQSPVCRKGRDTCFNERNIRYGYLLELERYIKKRIAKPAKTSHTTRLLDRGRPQIAKKVGEEAVELVIEAIEEDNEEQFKAEASDLLYHFMVMLADREIPLDDVLEVLRNRRK